MGKIYCIALCLIAWLFPVQSSGTVYMRDNVEDGISAAYTVIQNNGTGGVIDVSTDEHFLGAKSISLTYAAATTSGMGFEYNFPWVANDLYVRYAVKFPAGFQFDSTSTKVSRGWALPNGSPANDIVFIVRPKAGGGWKWSQYLNQEFGNGRTANVDSSEAAQVPTDGVWHCIDQHYQWDIDGPGTGAYEIWIDGVQGWGYTGRYMSAIPWTKAEIGGNFSSAAHSPVTQTMFYDHIVIADAPFVDKPSDGLCHAWIEADAWRVAQPVRPPKL